MAKIFKSEIDRGKVNLRELIEKGELERCRARIHLNGEDVESIWVAVDKINKVMYLMNHAAMFIPLPSWGMELPLSRNLDMTPYRGESFDDYKPIFISEAYEHLKKYVDEDNNFDYQAFIDKL